MPVLVLSMLAAFLLPPQSDVNDPDPWLDRAGARIERFWQEYSSVTSIEEVRQFRLAPRGNVISEHHAVFDYLMVMELRGARPRFEESRIARTGTEAATDGPLLITSGFSTLLLVFHPYFRTSFEYRVAEDTGADPGLRRVDFEAVRGQHSPAVLRLEGRMYPILWKGSAWIDIETGMVVRVEAGLGESMEGLGLHDLSATTEYARVQLGEDGPDYWLPRSTTIEVRTSHQHWRNQHEFREYRRFAVESAVELVESTQEPR